MTGRWLLPFTSGIDMRAVNTALAVVQKGDATLVALSLIAVPSGKRSHGVRLELIQQSQDFLETVKYRAERFAIPLERHEVYTENTLESLETLPQKLGCEGMILLSRGERALLLSNQEVRHMLSTVPLSLIVPKSMAEYSIVFMELPAGSTASSSSMSDHTLECCSSSKLCGSVLRVSESRKCAGHDNLIEQSQGASHSARRA